MKDIDLPDIPYPHNHCILYIYILSHTQSTNLWFYFKLASYLQIYYLLVFGHYIKWDLTGLDWICTDPFV